MLDREQALALLNELGPEKHLIQHALASEAVMRALARHLGEDEEVWGPKKPCTPSAPTTAR